jgi:hypothetical protein
MRFCGVGLCDNMTVSENRNGCRRKWWRPILMVLSVCSTKQIIRSNSCKEAETFRWSGDPDRSLPPVLKTTTGGLALTFSLTCLNTGFSVQIISVRGEHFHDSDSKFIGALQQLAKSFFCTIRFGCMALHLYVTQNTACTFSDHAYLPSWPPGRWSHGSVGLYSASDLNGRIPGLL